MTADTTSLELRLSRQVRAEIRATPAVLTEYRRQKKARRWPLLQLIAAIVAGTVGMVMMLVVLPAALMWAAVTHFGVDFTLGIAGLLATAAMLGFSEALLSMLRNSGDVTVASHLPVSDGDLAQFVWSQLAGAFCLTAYVAAFPLGSVAWIHGLNAGGWTLALSLGVVQAAVMIALGTILAVNRPRWAFGALAGALVVLAVGLIAGFAWLAPANRPPMVAEVLYRVTPGGWVNAVLGLGYLRGNIVAWFGLAAAGLIVALLYPAVQALKANYRIQSFEVEGNERATANIVGPLSRVEYGQEETDPEWSDAIATLERLYMGRTLADEIDETNTAARLRDELRMRSGDELGPVERLVHRFLKPRERVVADFLCAERSQWSNHLKLAALIVVVALPLGPLVGWGSLMLPVVLGVAATCLSGPWRGLYRSNAGGTYLPMWAVLPLDYREMVRVLYKVGAIRSVLATPIVTAGIAVPLLMMGTPMSVVLLSGLAWLAAMMMLLSWMASLSLNGFGLLPAFRWRRLPLYLPPMIAVLCPLIGFALILASFQFGGFSARLLAGGVGLMIAGSVIIRYYYQSLHRRGLLDPVSLNASKTEETRIVNDDNLAEAEIRRELARERHGRFWWRERALRRWVGNRE